VTIPVDLLTDSLSVKSILGLNGSAQDSLIDVLITKVSAAVANWMNRPIILGSNPCNPVTEFLSGRGHVRLLLSHSPVQAPVLMGSTVAGSPVVTGLPSTAYLFPGQCVSGINLAPGSAVLSVDSTTQVTLTKAAGASGSGQLMFGLGVWVDDQGYYGTAPGSFPPTSQLFEGSDFALRRDGTGGGSSHVGWLERLNGSWEGQVRRDRWALASHIGDSQGSIKVTAWYGYQSLPEDLKLATAEIVAFCRRWGPNAEAWSSESVGLALNGKSGPAQAPEIASARGVLAKYRRIKLR
jgi:hypothetical protein